MVFHNVSQGFNVYFKIGNEFAVELEETKETHHISN